MSDLKSYLDGDFLKLKNLLSKHTKRAYFVGGFTRDFYMYKFGLNDELKSCKDIDIEVYDIAPCKFDHIMKSIGAKGFGKSFFVYKYKNFDIALARKENKVSKGHRGFEVSVCDDEKAASKRRDFTINFLELFKRVRVFL